MSKQKTVMVFDDTAEIKKGAKEWDDIRKLKIEIEKGISSPTLTENDFLVRKKYLIEGQKAYELNLPPSLSKSNQNALVGMLLKDAKEKGENSVLVQADLPEECKVEHVRAFERENLVKNYLTSPSRLEALNKKISNLELRASISGAAALVFGATGLATGITALVLFGLGAAFPPLLIGIVGGCVLAALVGVVAIAYFKTQAGNAKDERTDTENDRFLEWNLRDSLVNFYEKRPQEKVSKDPSYVPTLKKQGLPENPDLTTEGDENKSSKGFGYTSDDD